MKKRRIIIGITGASGSIYGKLLIEKLITLKDQLEDCSIIFSTSSLDVWEYEIGALNQDSVPFKIYHPVDFFAPMASGSAGYDTMIICPCSMGTLGRIASGISGDLMTRAADVILKERKKLILVPREAPYSLIHLNNMKLLTEAGAIICPASPSFYSRPSTMNEVVMTVVEKVLTLSGLELDTYQWGNP